MGGRKMREAAIALKEFEGQQARYLAGYNMGLEGSRRQTEPKDEP